MGDTSKLVDQHIERMRRHAEAGTNPLRDGVKWREGDAPTTNPLRGSNPSVAEQARKILEEEA